MRYGYDFFEATFANNEEMFDFNDQILGLSATKEVRSYSAQALANLVTPLVPPAPAEPPKYSSGNPEGLVAANTSNFYIDTSNSKIYYNPNVGSTSGWMDIYANALEQQEQPIVGTTIPENIVTANKSQLYFNSSTNEMYFNPTLSNTGWILIAGQDRPILGTGNPNGAYVSNKSLLFIETASSTIYYNPNVNSINGWQPLNHVDYPSFGAFDPEGLLPSNKSRLYFDVTTRCGYYNPLIGVNTGWQKIKGDSIKFGFGEPNANSVAANGSHLYIDVDMHHLYYNQNEGATSGWSQVQP